MTGFWIAVSIVAVFGVAWGIAGNWATIKSWSKRSPIIEIVVGDITRERVDVIVNAAKASLMGGGGVDGAIHRAGGPAILDECKRLRADAYPDGLPTGEAVATTAGRLPAGHVVHTVGPVFRPGFDFSDADLLRNCYTHSINVADALGAETIAFPLISSGVYGWPVGDAVKQALDAISKTRPRNVKKVRLVLFDVATYFTAAYVANLA